MTTENPQRPLDQRREVSPAFSRREVLVVQGLVDGVQSGEFRKIDITLAPNVVKALKAGIAERFGGTIKASGLYRAVVAGVKTEKVRTDEIPDNPTEPFENLEINAIVETTKWILTTKPPELLNVSDKILAHISVKLEGGYSSYWTIAWVARDLKRQGRL